MDPRLKEALEHMSDCQMCTEYVDAVLGPVLGPEPPPKPPKDVSRWGMSPAEWAGGWL